MSPRPRLRFIFRTGLPAKVRIYIYSAPPPLRFIFRMGLSAKVQIYRSSVPPHPRFIFRMGLPAKVKMALFEALADCEYRLVRASREGAMPVEAGAVHGGPRGRAEGTLSWAGATECTSAHF